MNRKTIAALLVMLLGGQACVTSKLWKETDPQAWLWMDGDKISEAELQQRGVRYRNHQNARGNGYLIEKSGRQQLKDYQLRMLGTPVTLAADAAATVVVVGVFLLLEEPGLPILLIDGLRLCH